MGFVCPIFVGDAATLQFKKSPSGRPKIHWNPPQKKVKMKAIFGVTLKIAGNRGRYKRARGFS